MGIFLSIFFAVLSCSEKVLESQTADGTQTKNPSLKSASLNYYVAKTGNDVNPGSKALPFLTIKNGLSVATAGCTVFIKAGTYQEEIEFPSSGEVGNPITLKNYGTDVVTIDGSGAGDHCIFATGKSYLTIDGINVENAPSKNIIIVSCSNITIQNLSSIQPVGTNSNLYNRWNIDIRSLSDTGPISENITINNITTYGGDWGLSIFYYVNNVVVTGGEYSYSYMDGVNVGGYVADSSYYTKNVIIDGAYAHHNGRQGINAGTCNTVTIKNSHCSYNDATGINIDYDSDNLIIEDNLCEYNSRGGGSFNSAYEGGIWITSGFNIVRRNIIKGNQHGLIISEGPLTFQVYDNLIIGNNYNQQSSYMNNDETAGVVFAQCTGTFYNNVLYGNCAPNSHLGSIYTYPTGGTQTIPVNLTMKNNIIMNDGCTIAGNYNGDIHFEHLSDATVVSDNNLIYNANRAVVIRYNTWYAYSFSDYQTTKGQDAHSINANPLLVDVANGNFNLQSISPCINAGANVGLTSDYLKKLIAGLPDIGAYEYQGQVTVPPSSTVYYNTQTSATATKNDCGTGYTGSTVTYTVAASKYSSTLSQADADSKATADLTANKQTYANTNGTCTAVPNTTYYSAQESGTATKNDCTTGSTGSTVTYIVPAGKYSSTISQADANNKAVADVTANKQTYANANGTCTATTTVSTTPTTTTTTTYSSTRKKWWQR